MRQFPRAVGKMYLKNPSHWISFDAIKKYNPTSLLHIGCDQGNVVKRFELEKGIKAKGLESNSPYYLTRVTNNVIYHDVSHTPWPIADQEFDFIYSHSILHNLNNIEDVAKEIKRVSKRGLHSIDFLNSNISGKGWTALLGDNQTIIDHNLINFGSVHLTYNSGPVKFNIGCGNALFHYGWINVDINDLDEMAKKSNITFARHDVRGWIPTHDDGTTAIIASHFLDSLTETEVDNFLEECWRVLTIGGFLRISVPDTQKIQALDANLLGNWQTRYNKESLISLLQKVGFSRVKVYELGESSSEQIRKETYDTYPDISLFVECRKMVL